MEVETEGYWLKVKITAINNGRMLHLPTNNPPLSPPDPDTTDEGVEGHKKSYKMCGCIIAKLTREEVKGSMCMGKNWRKKIDRGKSA